ncbi:MAG: ribonuclease HII, partial [Candidatus Heimdallarchaeota archaeon]|nr:ribonuclease HII [Candidatus Heimdallarchaeota archaeon]
VGIDEAGRGPVIGPLVICVYVVEQEKHQDLKKMGAKDSKLLSKNQRETLYPKLKNIAADIKIKHLSPAEIDELRKSISLNVIEQQIMLKLTKEVKHNLETIYIDAADVNEKRFGLVFEKEFPGTKIVSKHKADTFFPVVSAASIIAKVERDREIESLKLKMSEDIGSGYPADPKTKSFLKKYFSKHKKFPPFVRESWDTAKRIRKEHSDSKLTDYF